MRLLTGPVGRNLEKTHVRVIAENVPLGVFAGALSDALGVGVAVRAPLVSVRVGLALPDVDMSDWPAPTAAPASAAFKRAEHNTP